ncbi:G-protein coupled receptor GRL101-like [Amphibalanus amphitrite]|uniref:G-protein coupled receptor GRL101-like n=1 Tax=Amphibalanus amphitrite TaxID=1232801 RepID=UPI001C9283AD|nr:G-protein coupled receptor GRL101-like [Amphibalanus amphitrite]
MMFQNMFRLHVLDLRDNHITVLKNRTFFGLQNVRALFLTGNRLQRIEESAFLGLSSLAILDLSHQRLTYLSSRCFLGLRKLANLNLSNNGLRHLEVAAFTGLSKLVMLDITNNDIEDPPKEVFRSLTSLNRLETDLFGLCCLARHVPTCLPAADEFSSCEDLMSNTVLRLCIWVLGAVALVGNVLVMCWRVLHKTSNRVHSFLIMNLAFSDCLMGVYLLMIAAVDQYYRGRYSVHAVHWRSSRLCHLAGFVSTFSSELSVFTLTVITLDRFLVIIFPFHLDRLEMSRTRLIMATGWTAVALLAASPLMPLSYFSGFYGRSGVCLALHITPDYPPGWEYSVFVFLVLNLISFGVIALGYTCMFVAAKRTQAAVPALRRRSKRSTRSDGAMARRMTLIVATDAACWLPIIALGIASLCGVRVPPQIYAWVAVFVLPLNAAVNPLLYTLSTVQFVEQVEKRLHTFRVSWKRSFTMKTCTTAVTEGRANDQEHQQWSPRVYRFGPAQQSESVDTVALVTLSHRRQRPRVQVTGSLTDYRGGKKHSLRTSQSLGVNQNQIDQQHKSNGGARRQFQLVPPPQGQQHELQAAQKQRQRQKKRNNELYE